ncbi:hypothetical protein IFM47457_00510 [Aspergillus lentulus]|nr:hypothetical protein IFM47457_00510 [Aspergillus lentulus]
MRQHATVSYTGGERWTTEKAGKPGEKRDQVSDGANEWPCLSKLKTTEQEEKRTTTPRRKTTMMRTRVYLEGRGKRRARRKLQGNDKTGTDGDRTRPLPSPIASGTVHRNTTSPLLEEVWNHLDIRIS